MFPQMKTVEPSTTAAAIEEFQKVRNLALPALYIDFLLATNGGVPTEPAFPIEGMVGNPIGVIQVLFGIGVPDFPTNELSYAYDLYSGAIPAEVLPIATTGGGDYICLDLRKNRGSVVFWDKRHFWGTGEWREADLYRVANGFEEFLIALKPNPY